MKKQKLSTQNTITKKQRNSRKTQKTPSSEVSKLGF